LPILTLPFFNRQILLLLGRSFRQKWDVFQCSLVFNRRQPYLSTGLIVRLKANLPQLSKVGIAPLLVTAFESFWESSLLPELAPQFVTPLLDLFLNLALEAETSGKKLPLRLNIVPGRERTDVKGKGGPDYHL